MQEKDNVKWAVEMGQTTADVTEEIIPVKMYGVTLYAIPKIWTKNPPSFFEVMGMIRALKEQIGE